MDIQDIVLKRVPQSDIDRAKNILADAACMSEDQSMKDSLSDVLEMLSSISESMYNLEWEKNLLVCLLALEKNSVLSPHRKHEQGWDPEDGWLVYVELETGQVSFHITRDLKLLLSSSVKVSNIPVWDGHDLNEKWKRILKHIALVSNQNSSIE